MDLLGMVAGLPLLPFRGLGALLEILRDQAEQERYGSSGLHGQAEEIDELVGSGQISADEGEQRQEQALAHAGVVPSDSARTD